MIKNYGDFVNEASTDTQIKTIEADIAKLYDQIQTAKDAVKTAANDAARKTAQINAYTVESTILGQISAKLKDLIRLMSAPVTKI